MSTSEQDLFDQARGYVIREQPELVGALDDGAGLEDLGDDTAFWAAVDAEHARLCAAAGIKPVNSF